ncbi:hypothetical protein Celaphus_00016490 [Cervus elaphus hippelaphus]|uniref:Uncharacterized protein n=1 Tax=Cervus elaphus hippelaphus TaxID=46360 RepID=A0A212C496_CEREH|nr:hypothetical protein Celaphus_00016490 [Cervus elaphus hippelaphus]
MAYSEKQGDVPCGFIRQNSGSSIPLVFEPDAEHQFAEPLQKRYKHAFCRCVLHPRDGLRAPLPPALRPVPQGTARSPPLPCR